MFQKHYLFRDFSGTRSSITKMFHKMIESITIRKQFQCLPMSSEVVPLFKKGNEIILSILRVKLRNIFGHKNPADGTFGYFFQLCICLYNIDISHS